MNCVAFPRFESTSGGRSSIHARIPLLGCTHVARSSYHRLVTRVALLFFTLFSILFAAAVPASAQDEALDPLLFAPRLSAADEATDLQARTLQLYRLPLAIRLRPMDEQHWGIRVTFPVSLQSLRVSGVSDLGPFTKKLGIAGLVPGVELEIPLRPGVRMRPFAEAGFGKASDGKTEALYGVGAGLMVERQVHVAHLTYGGLGMYRNSYTSGDEYDGHGTFEAGIDTQVPLGFSIERKEARAGVYVIARKFVGLDLLLKNQETLTIDHQYEVGASFATSPVLSIWKLKLPWIAVGYHFGRTLSGVRIYTKFPF